MSPLLDQAVAEARKLSVAQQDAIAAFILEEIEDDRRWDESLSRSTGKLAALDDRAKEQLQAGQFKIVGFDELCSDRLSHPG